MLGVEGSWILLPAAAAIFGHWNSIFSRFRGGDGLATLGGVMIALFAMGGVVGVAIGGIVSLGGQRIPYTSLLSVVFGYSAVAMLSLLRQEQLALTLGVGGLAAMVLAHAISGHMKRRQGDEWEELGDTGAAESTGAG
jgi:glycerol-3-phosphate acyltransferase PlsY